MRAWTKFKFSSSTGAFRRGIRSTSSQLTENALRALCCHLSTDDTIRCCSGTFFRNQFLECLPPPEGGFFFPIPSLLLFPTPSDPNLLIKMPPGSRAPPGFYLALCSRLFCCCPPQQGLLCPDRPTPGVGSGVQGHVIARSGSRSGS